MALPTLDECKRKRNFSGAKMFGWPAVGNFRITSYSHTIEGCEQKKARVFDAIKNRDLKTLESVLNSEEMASCRNTSGMTPLMAAIDQPDVSITLIQGMLLIPAVRQTCGAAVTGESNLDGFTALCIAAWRGNVDVIAALKDAGTDMNAATQHGRFKGMAAVHLAALRGHASSIAVLKDAGADIDAAAGAGNFIGISAVHFAASSGHANAIAALKYAGADMNALTRDGSFKGGNALHIAAMCGHANAITVLKDSVADVNAVAGDGVHKGLSAVHIAASNNHADAIAALKTAGADMNSTVRGGKYKGLSAVHIAALTGTASMIRALEKAGANMNAEANDGAYEHLFAIHLAAIGRKADAFQALLDILSTMDTRGNKADRIVKGKLMDNLRKSAMRFVSSGNSTAFKSLYRDVRSYDAYSEMLAELGSSHVNPSIDILHNFKFGLSDMDWLNLLVRHAGLPSISSTPEEILSIGLDGEESQVDENTMVHRKRDREENAFLPHTGGHKSIKRPEKWD
jgi:ankyrin repeat protein